MWNFEKLIFISTSSIIRWHESCSCAWLFTPLYTFPRVVSIEALLLSTWPLNIYLHDKSDRVSAYKKLRVLAAPLTGSLSLSCRKLNIRLFDQREEEVERLWHWGAGRLAGSASGHIPRWNQNDWCVSSVYILGAYIATVNTLSTFDKEPVQGDLSL